MEGIKEDQPLQSHDAFLMDVIDKMSVEAVETMAMKYLGVTHPQIQTISASQREDIAARKFKVLYSWKEYLKCLYPKFPNTITLRSKSLTWNIYTCSSGCNVLAFCVFYIPVEFQFKH